MLAFVWTLSDFKRKEKKIPSKCYYSIINNLAKFNKTFHYSQIKSPHKYLGGVWLTSAVKFKSNIKIKKLPENGEHKWNYFKIGQNNGRTGVPLPPPPYPPKIDL